MKGVPALFASMKSLLNTSKNDDIENREWYEVWDSESGNLIYFSWDKEDAWNFWYAQGDDDLVILRLWENGKKAEPIPT
jgi:hypothetical protein